MPVELPDEVVHAIAEQAATIVLERVAVRDEGWIRGAKNAAAYMNCKEKRVYDLAESGRLEHRKDGNRLMFRREWLDACLDSPGARRNGRP